MFHELDRRRFRAQGFWPLTCWRCDSRVMCPLLLWCSPKNVACHPPPPRPPLSLGPPLPPAHLCGMPKMEESCIHTKPGFTPWQLEALQVAALLHLGSCHAHRQGPGDKVRPMRRDPHEAFRGRGQKVPCASVVRMCLRTGQVGCCGAREASSPCTILWLHLDTRLDQT